MIKSFTLVETIIAIFIFASSLILSYGFIAKLYQTQNYTFQQSNAINEARIGIQTMAKEIREARSGEDGSFTLEQADDYEFIFFSDIDNDNLIERVRYFISGADFKKSIIEPIGIPAVYITDPLDPDFQEKTSIISSYVRNSPPIFRYFDINGTELPAPARLKDTVLMEVYLVINVDPQRAPSDFTLKTRVQIRNLK